MIDKLGRCLAGALLLAGTLYALDPDKRMTQYLHKSWRIQDGSAPAAVGTITQTPDGFIWLQSLPSDVYRFDGVRFLPYPLYASVLPINIFADRTGAFWSVGAREIGRFKDGVVSRFPVSGRGETQSISQDPDGSMWFLTSVLSEPLCHIQGESVRCFGKPDGIPVAHLQSLLSDREGGFWLGGDTILVHWRAGLSESYPIEALKANTAQTGIVALARAPDETLWIGIFTEGPGRGLGRLIGGTFQPFVTPRFDGSELSVTGLLFDRDGNLWVSSDNKGIFRIRGNVVDHYGHTDGLSDDSVQAIFEDREGIIWAATSSGMDNFRDPHVTTFSPLEGLGKGEARGVLATKDGTVWISNASSLDHIAKGAVSSIRAGQGLPGNQVTSLFQDREGNMWVGVDDSLYQFKDGSFRRLPEWNHQPLGMVIGITEDIAGNIWAECKSNPRKLVRIRDFQVREEFSASRLPLGRALASDPGGGIWMATLTGDIALFRNGVIETQFPLNPGGSPVNRQLLTQADGSVLAGSENGLVGWRHGRVQRMTTKNGLPCDRVVYFVQDKEKRWWLDTGCGVVELPDSELQRWWANPTAVVQNRLYDVLDGARIPVFPNYNESAYSSDGRVWFATGAIVQMIDTARLEQKALPATTYIESLTVDRKEVPANGNVELAPHPREVRIDYTSPTFLIPEKVKFRYRLDSYDHDWNDVGTRRQAFYMDLPPGKYSFRVIACNSDGVWNDRAAKLDFSIAPAYYETNWFRALCGALFLTLLWAAYQLRVKQLHRELEARVAERTRIARDLHDTLLQSAHGVLLRFETVSQLFHDRPAEAKQRLDSAIQQTASFITEARDQVQGLRDSTEPSNDLAADINSLGEALARNSATKGQIAFQIAVEGEARHLRPILRDDIYKICAEALRNSFQHSGARRVEVEIRYDPSQFRLRVRDDGKGIDPAILARQAAEGHYGLPGMRERATIIGGNLTVWSKVQEGTEVELSVPHAYAAARRRWWLPRRSESSQ